MANLGIHFDELANELLEVAKLDNFAFGLFLSGRGRKDSLTVLPFTL